MKFKVVPVPPESLDFVETAHRAVPLVAGSVDDCCARMMAKANVPARDQAREWLTFLQALGLAKEGDSGFSRVRKDYDTETLAAAFRERVFGADELITLLEDADGVLTPLEAFDRFEDTVPNWERHRHPETWEDIWTERVRRLLEWAVLLDLASRADGGYRA
ncbi:hypothetical protein ACFQH3_03215 [Haladaptatus sp. GCM10025707]|uniref:hypothetical protein n=1 Tax=unclassified Haladaptatus TaxID=2622732 RepID=UPI0023E8D44F|nr:MULTISPECIES: hypothetical protein [unclassified Haladaptatus]